MRIEIIRSKICEISEGITTIEEYPPGDVEEFKKLGINGIYRRTEFVLQNVIDIFAILNYTGSLKLLKKSWRVKNGSSRISSG
ncbi:hypothetical protein ADU37_CDS09030 [Thermococcus sp. 2319x1]|uniref:hypothetical protein n=1 Tax=Thermococcus sp. 2319x1 TaxID=1674923 RepID=UPI00073A5D59|nr:hypothetical protein [Thermococcus sp. 2319x1]ALV62602.1 hypothetical protein ADU37_CDS09030 [Thermococcus sp. 2319x1]